MSCDVSSPVLNVSAGADYQHQLMDGRQEHVPGSLLPSDCWDSSAGLNLLPDHLPPGVLWTGQAAQVWGCQSALLESQLTPLCVGLEAAWRQISVLGMQASKICYQQVTGLKQPFGQPCQLVETIYSDEARVRKCCQACAWSHRH